MTAPANNDARRRWHFLYVKTASWRHFNVHRDRDCHRLSVQISRFGFRWLWP